MAASYPEVLVPENVIVPLSEGTETPSAPQSAVSITGGHTGPHSVTTGLSDRLNIPTIDSRQLAALEKIVAILERFEALAERIPFLKKAKS